MPRIPRCASFSVNTLYIHIYTLLTNLYIKAKLYYIRIGLMVLKTWYNENDSLYSVIINLNFIQ